MLISIVLWSFCYTFIKPKSSIVHLSDLSGPLKWALSIPILVGFVAAPLSGWSANMKFGNYKVFRVGAVLLFIATVMNCLFRILEELVWESNHSLQKIHLLFCSSLTAIGGCTCVVTALPLGLDQMPDASSSNIASYIAWFVSSIYAGGLIAQGFYILEDSCLESEIRTHSNYTLFWPLLLVVCMSILLASNFSFRPKWLIIEPKSPKSLKTIYQVLKFAAKHKAPLNRSAFTYWEEDVPSRIDLGKSKYGGPFTTEQVEDVKTILRLLTISLAFAVITFSFTQLGMNVLHGYAVNGRLIDLNACSRGAVNVLLFSIFWYGFSGSVVHEFVVYPLIINKLPSMLKRIGAVSLLITFTTLICFTLKLAHFYSPSSRTVTEWIVQILQQATNGILFQFLLTLILQFVCAQSPYNMRGLLLSLVVIFLITFVGAQVALGFYFTTRICTQPWCPLVSYSVQLVLHIFGFLLFCVVARWYKVRVRDDDYSPQRVVEEVYDRYLTAAAAHSRFYGATYHS